MGPVPESVLRFNVQAEQGRRCEACVVIDSTINSSSCGGLSLVSELNPDVLSRVARSRTRTLALLGLPLGGAAAAIVVPSHSSASLVKQSLSLFGQAAYPLLVTQRFWPEPCLGLDDAEIRYMLEEAGVTVPRHMLRGSSGRYAGLTVALSVLVALRTAGVKQRGATAAVEGFGKMGSAVALALHERGVKVVAVSTKEGALFDGDGLDVPDLLRRQAHYGKSFVHKPIDADRIPVGEIRRLAVDVLCPCAVPENLEDEVVGQLRCRALVPGAAMPLHSTGEDSIVRRGILYVPELVAGCGDALAGVLLSSGLTDAGVREFIERRFTPLLEWLVEAADRKGIPLHEYATHYSEERFARRKRASDEGRRVSRYELAMGLYHRRLVPSVFVRRVSVNAIASRLLPDGDDGDVPMEWAHAAGRP
ncbi:MAG: Glu/Leu/Phe/Val dehydrogenase [Dehalococcoidia bacterium]|nr:Glu/Leu/Phe/Val dehydrogenase [Dehalococcoidia bacterium]